MCIDMHNLQWSKGVKMAHEHNNLQWSKGAKMAHEHNINEFLQTNIRQ